jgi:beta propeller repeat protein
MESTRGNVVSTVPCIRERTPQDRPPRATRAEAGSTEGGPSKPVPPRRSRSSLRLAGSLAIVGALAVGILLLALFAPPRPADAAAPVEEFPVSTTVPNQFAPAISGDLVVWQEYRDGLSGVYGRRLPDGEEFVISAGTRVKKRPATNGGFVVWEDHRNGNPDVYGYDLSTGREFPIATGPGYQRKPAISGDTVVWEDSRGDNWEIYRYDLSSKQESRVTNGAGDKFSPDVSGDMVVWREQPMAGISGIYARNISTGERFAVSTGEAFADTPAISDGVVVWRQESVANYDIFGRDLYAKDLETGEVFQITTDVRDQVSPAISGDIVVWGDNRGGNTDIYGKDLSTGEVFQVAAGYAPQEVPAISGETVVWEEQRVGGTHYGSYDLYGADIDTAPAAPHGLSAAGSPEGVALDWQANTEGDLVGYNVYRGDSGDGAYTRLNAELLPENALSYEDADAPKGVVSFYRVTAVDASGNESAPAEARSVAQIRTNVTLKAGSSVLRYGGTTALSGKLTAGDRVLPGRPVILEQKPAGARRFGLVPGGRLTTGDSGGLSIKVRPLKNTRYRGRFAGEPDQGLLPSDSVARLVKVRPKVSLDRPKRNRGSRVDVGGRVVGARTGWIEMVIKRNGEVISHKNLRLRGSRYRLVYKPPGAGNYVVRANLARSAAHMDGRSPLRKFRVSG